MDRRRFLTRVEIQTKDVGHDLQGEPIDNWTTTRRERIDLRPLSGLEYMQAQQMASRVTHKAWSNYFDGASSQMRMRIGDRVLEVESVFAFQERQRFLEWRLIENA